MIQPLVPSTGAAPAPATTGPSQSPSAPGGLSAQGSAGETGAAGTRALSPERVEPPAQPRAPVRLGGDLLPRNPDAPAGPPPAFEANVLDRAREAVGDYDVPPEPAQRAEADLSATRARQDPEPEPAIDLSR